MSDFLLSVPAVKTVKAEYGAFSGISEKTDNAAKSPFCQNMFCDRTADANALTTRPSYMRATASFPGSNGENGFAIFSFEGKAYVRTGTYFIRWDSFPETPPQGVPQTCSCYTVLASDLPSAATPLFSYSPASAVFDGALYIFEPSCVLCYNGSSLRCIDSPSSVILYPSSANPDSLALWQAPTAFINCDASGAAQAHEPMNMLSPYCRVEFTADGTSLQYSVPEGYTPRSCTGGGTVSAGKIVFEAAPESGTRFTVLASVSDTAAYVLKWKNRLGTMRLCTVFDNRLFLSASSGGSQASQIYYSAVSQPLYFPDNAYVRDGERITAMGVFGSELAIICADTFGTGSVFVHTPLQTENDFAPKIYPAKSVVANAGCVNARCGTSIDDKLIFLSKNGVKALDKTEVFQQRTVKHLSSDIDRRLSEIDFSTASVCAWKSYIVVLAGTTLFLGDMKSLYRNSETLSYQPSWYVWEGIGFDDGENYRIKTLFLSDTGTQTLVLYNQNGSVGYFGDGEDFHGSVISFCATPVEYFGQKNRFKRLLARGCEAYVEGEAVEVSCLKNSEEFGAVEMGENGYSFSNTAVSVDFKKYSQNRMGFRLKNGRAASYSFIFHSQRPFTFYGATLTARILNCTE